MTQIAGRVAFVTGGASGIGLGIAHALADAGAAVAIADVDQQRLGAACAELSTKTRAYAVQLDVRDRAAFTKCADEVETALGPVSILVNNAGVAGGAHVKRMTYDHWDWVIGINLNGVINGLQTFVPRILERGAGGHIVNTSSGSGLAAFGTGIMYTSSKFAVVGLSEALRLELAPYDVGVTVLCPGAVRTNILATTRKGQPSGMGGDLSEKERGKQLATWTLMETIIGKGASPADVGGMVTKGIGNNELYVVTDDSALEIVSRRHKAIEDALRIAPKSPLTSPETA